MLSLTCRKERKCSSADLVRENVEGSEKKKMLIYFMTLEGLCGIPENLIQAILDTGKRDLTVVSNNAGE